MLAFLALIQIATWLVPTLILTGLGIVLAVVCPITGLCFCCCRCFGKCGANDYKYKNKHEVPKCLTLSIISFIGYLFLMWVLTLTWLYNTLAVIQIRIGLLLGFLSNERLATAVRGYPSTLTSAITDSVNYVNGTLNVSNSTLASSTIYRHNALTQEVTHITDNGLNTALNTITSDIRSTLIPYWGHDYLYVRTCILSCRC